MTKFFLFGLLPTILLTTTFSAEAQQPKKVPRIGYLSGTGSEAPTAGKFRQGLRELGYVEGKNIVFEYRSVEGKLEEFTHRAAELVSLKVDVIFAVSTPAALAAQSA